MSAPVAALDEERTAFLARFGFREFDVVTTLEGGMFSRPLLVEADGRRRLLRTHTFRATVESFQFQAEAIAAAAVQGVLCAQVVPLEDGGWSQPVVGRHAVMALHEFVEGCTDDWPQWHARKESPGFLPNLGRQTARLHNALRTATPGGEPVLPIDLPPIQFDRLDEIQLRWDRDLVQLQSGGRMSRSLATLIKLQPRIAGHWRRLAEAVGPRLTSLPRQIVHGDISPVNLLVGAGGWAFIDWDCVHVGWRLYDALGDVLNRPPVERPELNRFRADHVAAYLRGYAEALDEPLSADEKSLVLAFCVARQLEDLRQRVRALPALADRHDAEYATLIVRRVDMLDQIARIDSSWQAEDFFEA